MRFMRVGSMHIKEKRRVLFIGNNFLQGLVQNVRLLMDLFVSGVFTQMDVFAEVFLEIKVRTDVSIGRYTNGIQAGRF